MRYASPRANRRGWYYIKPRNKSNNKAQKKKTAGDLIPLPNLTYNTAMPKNNKPKRIKIKLVTTMCIACREVYRTSNPTKLLCFRCAAK